jgi:methyl-accepting chemotaxis protein
MFRIANLKIGIRLALGFSLLLLLLTLIAVLSTARLSSQNDIVERMTSNLYPKVDASRQLQVLTTDRGRLARHILLAPDNAAKTASKVIFDNEVGQITEQMAVLDKLVDTDKGRAALTAVKSALDEVNESQNEAVALAMQNKTQEAVAFMFSPRFKSAAVVAVPLNDLINVQEQAAQEGAKQASEIYEKTRILMLAAVVIALLIGLGIAWLITQSVVVPVQTAVDAAKSIATGDLTGHISSTAKDETGLLLNCLEDMRQRLTQTITVVRSGSDNVRVAARQISQGNDDLSQRTQEQAASLEETASSMEEMASTVKQTAENSAHANQLAQSARSQAEKGGQIVAQAVTAMNEINASSHKIADIIGVIDGIAFQTNILALNAAVEAARAGEQGGGFAVVATEVRNLAQRSAQAAKEIKHLISDSVTKVGAGSTLVQESGDALSEIVDSVKKVTEIVAEIAVASQEQTHGVDQVTLAVSQMDEVTQQNAALVEEASAAAHALSGQADELAELMAFFRVGGTSATLRAQHQAAIPMPQRVIQNAKQAGERMTARKREDHAVATAGANTWKEF